MFAAMSCIATMSLTSCATILSGSANKIYIDGDVDEPVTIVTEKQTYENVELPAMVKINRHGIDGQRVKIKSENYEYKDIVIEKKINAVTFGNILLGGIPGWLVDLATNCVSMPQKKHLTSSSCHPKIFVKEFSYFLMPCHQHCLGVNLLVQR